MQWGHIRQALQAAYAADPENNHRARTVARRVNKFMRRRSKARLRAFREANMHLDMQERLPNYHLLTQALEENWKIVSIDCEWTMRRAITEIGVTIFHNGEIQAFNICVAAGGKGFLHGTSRYMQDKHAREWLTETLADAQLVVGHAFKNDVRQMTHWSYRMPQLPVVDTGKWSKIIFPPHEMSLSKLAKKYDVECRGAHCGGNDALMTLKVALKMYEHVSQPMVLDEAA